MTLLLVSQAPLDKLQPYKRHGLEPSWVSTAHTDFNFDLGFSHTEEQGREVVEQMTGSGLPPIVEHNARATGTDAAGYMTESPGFSTFVRDDAAVYHTYSTTWRGLEFVMGYYPILDAHRRVADEEREAWQLWIRRHDEYEESVTSADRRHWWACRRHCRANSCTGASPSIRYGRAPSTHSCSTGARRSSEPRPAHTWPSTRVGIWAAGLSSAARGARSGCLASRSTGSTGPPSARVSSEHSCCWNRERDRRDGAASSRALKQGSRALGAEAMSDERHLLEAAQAGDEEAFALLLGPYQAQLAALLPNARLIARCRGRAARDDAPRVERARPLRESKLASLLAHRIATNASLRFEKRPKRVLPIDYGPAADPHVAFGEPLTESIWLEPYPDAQLGVEATLLGGCALRTAREHRARLRRRVPAPARPATSSPDPPTSSASPPGRPPRRSR